MPYKCVARNADPRPTENIRTKMDIQFGKYTRKPEHHPYYNYLEVNVVQETCVQDQFNAQGLSEINKFYFSVICTVLNDTILKKNSQFFPKFFPHSKSLIFAKIFVKLFCTSNTYK